MLEIPVKFQQGIERPDAQTFAYLAIETAGQSDGVDTETEFDTKKVGIPVNVDYNSTPPPPVSGNLILAKTAAGTREINQGFPLSDISTQWSPGTNNYSYIDDWIDQGDLVQVSGNHGTLVDRYTLAAQSLISGIYENGEIVSVNVDIRSERQYGNLDYGIRINNTDYLTAATITATPWTNTYAMTVNPDTSSAWTLADIQSIQQLVISATSTSELGYKYVYSMRIYVVIKTYETAGNITFDLDLGVSANTDNEAIVLITENVPIGTGITYSLLGSDAGTFTGEETNLGNVTDCSRVAGYRFYRITISMTSDGNDTPVLKSIEIEIPDDVYRFVDRNRPVIVDNLNAHPSLNRIPGRTVQVDLTQFISIGSNYNIGLVRNEIVDAMVLDNYVKEFRTRLMIGVVDPTVTVDDLVPYYQGKIQDYVSTADEVTLEIKDESVGLTVKLPKGIPPSTKPVPITYDGWHIVDVILDLLDLAGLDARSIHDESFALVKANIGDTTLSNPPPDPGNWKVKRLSATAISEPKPARDFLKQLLQLAGCYMVTLEDGRIHLIEYDRTTSAIDSWVDQDFITNPVYDAGLDKLKNEIGIYYNWDGSGSEIFDFGNVYIQLDADSVVKNGSEEKEIRSNWLAGNASDGYYGAELAANIAERETVRLGSGLAVLSGKTNLTKVAIQVGDMITVQSDQIISPDTGLGDAVKFMVIKKTWDLDGQSFSWDMVEVK